MLRGTVEGYETRGPPAASLDWTTSKKVGRRDEGDQQKRAMFRRKLQQW